MVPCRSPQAYNRRVRCRIALVRDCRKESVHEFQQVRHRSVGFDGMSELGTFSDHVVIPSPHASAFHDLRVLELGYDLLDRSLCDPNLDGNFSQQNVGISV